VQSAASHGSRRILKRGLACVLICVWSGVCAKAQRREADFPLPTTTVNTGSDPLAQIDLKLMYLDQMNRSARESEQRRKQDKDLVDTGMVSALDLEAPNKAVAEYNRATSLMKARRSKEAIKHLQKAIAIYPKFVSAHVGLGLAYLDADDLEQARSEFETAATLDERFSQSFLNLGLVALSQNDFAAAATHLERAVSLRPKDARILSALAYAQHGNHQYLTTIETARQVHTLNHKQLASVHYVAASAAMSLKDYETVERELGFFVSEDPTNAFAPIARRNLAALAHNRAVRAATASNPKQATTLVATLRPETFPNSDRLKTQLSDAEDEPVGDTCEDCGTFAGAGAIAGGPLPEGDGSATSALSPALRPVLPATPHAWTIRTDVDQVSLFFSVSSHGHMVNDLAQSEIRILDDNKPPETIEQFAPQSKLPLRLALLVDTSGSVQKRFSFEKHAATKFLEKMLSSSSDLGFVEGFSDEATITQDFTADPGELGMGIEKLSNGGGTALFDAVLLACRKLAAYPETERVARVVVVLSDGEDNSSRSSLKQSIQVAESTNVTVYTVSTKEGRGDKTDADRVLEVLSKRSGGESLFPGDVMTLGNSLSRLHDLIRSRYFVAYKPADFQPNGSYRTINVTAQKDGQRLQVRTRKGYRVRVEPVHNPDSSKLLAIP
jgi:VWFA-related protein